MDQPRLYQGDSQASPLRGKNPYRDLNAYLEDHEEISFVIHKHYSCLAYHALPEVQEKFTRIKSGEMDPDIAAQLRPYLYILPEDTQIAAIDGERFEPRSKAFRESINAVRDLKPQNLTALSGWDYPGGLLAPYLLFYHAREILKEAREESKDEIKCQVDLLLAYLDNDPDLKYSEADDQLKTGHVTSEHFSKAFAVDDVIVTVEDGHHVGLVAKRIKPSSGKSVELTCHTWTFDGVFKLMKKQISVSLPETASVNDSIPVSSLSAWPLRLDRTDLGRKLRRRGEFFWTCRKPRLVSSSAQRQVFEIQLVSISMPVVNFYRFNMARRIPDT